MSEKPWYQDGFVVLCSVVVGTLVLAAFINQWINGPKELVVPKYSGRIHQPLLGTPSFELSVWHQHPGNLRNGVLKVTTLGELSKTPEQGHTEYHSFEIWEPNQANAVHLSLPLSRVDATAELTLRIQLEAKNAKPSTFHAKWQGDGWKE